jgi:HK97 family phage major capsid protein
LQEAYGVFRRNSRVWGMSSETANIPKLTAGPNPVYWVAEGSTIGESTLTFAQINLVAKKLATIVNYTSELAEDSLIDFAEFTASELAWRFSQEEDRVGFLGTGAAGDGAITGVIPALLALDPTPANIASLVIVPAGTGWSAVTLDLLTQMVGRLPQFAAARSQDSRWFCSRNFFYSVLLDLALKSGGVTESEVIAGLLTPKFLGFPVEITQILPTTYAAGAIPLLFGNLNLATAFGDRRQLSLLGSQHYQYSNDLLSLRATERFAINCHSLGNASATPSSRIAGPVIGLYCT